VSTNFPTSLDTFAVLVDNTDSIVAAHPNDRGDSVESLEAKVGINSSAVGTSHDYLLEHLPTQAANWDAGPYEVRAETFESDVATGTAPMTIASTTVVTNLNANTVNGKSAPSGTIVGTTDSQTLTNKTLTSPDINTGTFNGTIDGNWTAAGETCADLGTVTTTDINGGTIDGVTIGGAVAPTVTDIDINGGTVNGITSLGLSTGTDITEISIDTTLAGDSDNAVPTEKAVKAYVDNSSVAFGSWVDKGTSAIASTQATTDGFLMGTVTCSSSPVGAYAYGYSDASATPTTIRGSASALYNTGNTAESAGSRWNSFMIPVKKDDYYKTTQSKSGAGGATYQYYWMPLS